MKKLLTLAMLAAVSTTIHAATPFTFQNQPISPVCLAKMLNVDEVQSRIMLSTCANIPESSQVNRMRYAVIGNDADKFLIVTHHQYAGPGDYSNVVWMQKTIDSLQLLKILASGDRCNKGVQAVGVFQYGVNLTPVDLVGMGSGTPLKLNAYRDLDVGAESCVAQAIYQFDPKTQAVKLLQVKFNKKPLSMEKWVLDINYQYCFNRLYNSYLDRGQISLNQTDLDRFKNQFEAICMQSGR